MENARAAAGQLKWQEITMNKKNERILYYGMATCVLVVPVNDGLVKCGNEFLLRTRYGTAPAVAYVHKYK